MAMHNPPHPGGIVRRQCLEPLGLTVTAAADQLGVSRQSLSELVNEHAGVSVDMALRLTKAFGSTPETWLGPGTGSCTATTAPPNGSSAAANRASRRSSTT